MNWTDSSKPILALAPLADYTDSPFCCVCRKVANTPPTPLKRGFSDFIIFREMVSAEAIVRGNEKTLKMCEFKKPERPIVIQIFGSNPKTMAKATEIIVKKFKPDGIDINMGCPVPKIVGKGESGAALMKDHKRACEIVKEVKKVLVNLERNKKNNLPSFLPRKLGRFKKTNIPLSIKTRLGWSNSEDILEFVPKLEKAGADLITIHGRTKTQGYMGKADWGMIACAKRTVKIPVLANGDILSPADAKKCLQITKCDGVMIGRGALGNPWMFNQFIANSSQPIDFKEKIKVILYHAKLHEKQYGSLVSFRKHLMWYFKGDRMNLKNLKLLRQELAKVESLEGLKLVFKDIAA